MLCGKRKERMESPKDAEEPHSQKTSSPPGERSKAPLKKRLLRLLIQIVLSWLIENGEDCWDVGWTDHPSSRPQRSVGRLIEQ